ncbi:MAG: hypothetical protein HY423_06515 [Candidatus Lambdaproteobacteria bacterium]|nr:hypothetical protein [Candidatus Lambdaproteobacteria bacterium]
MSVKRSSKLVQAMEWVISYPPRASLLVGSTIVAFQLLVLEAAKLWPPMDNILYLMPFLPPLVVTAMAKRVNQRRAQHDFVNDAEPLVFVAFPKAATAKALLSTLPDMMSDSSSTHLNTPMDELMEMPALAAEFVAPPAARTEIVTRLVASYEQDGHRGTVRNTRIDLIPRRSSAPVPYIMNSVLRDYQGRLKWQATLTPQV